MKSLTLLLALVASSVLADKIPDFVVPGRCPAVDEKKLYDQQTPNFSKYEGIWYEYALTNNPYQQLKQCVQNEYSYNDNEFSIKSTGFNGEGNLIRRDGKLSPHPEDPHLMIDFEGSFLAPYVVLETDYDNYACMYSCMDYNYGYYSDFAFIFSRSPSLSETHLKKCQTAFRNIGIDTSRFLKTPQGSDCPYNTQRSL